jgi:hypothetical protein
VANPWATDRPAGGWLPEGRIFMTPLLPPNYCPFSVCLIMAATVSQHFAVTPNLLVLGLIQIDETQLGDVE